MAKSHPQTVATEALPAHTWLEYLPLGIPPDFSGLALHHVGYWRRNTWLDFPLVLHPFWRCYYNLRAGHRVIFPDGAVELGPHAFVIIPDQLFFRFQGGPPTPHLALAFSLDRRLAPTQPLPLEIAPGAAERDTVTRLLALLDAPQTADFHHRVAHLAQALLHLLLGHPTIEWRTQRSPEGVRRARTLIDQRYAEPLRMADLAREAGQSVRRFGDAFRRHEGVTAAQFLRQVRVRQAALRLAGSADSIEAIAAATGFPNRHYLTRLFSRMTGVSPARFRRMQQ